MAVLTGHQLALTTARVSASRVGATRVSFIPTKTWNGTTPGTAGRLYIWTRPERASATWTTVTR